MHHTKRMKYIITLSSLLLLITSCSNPDGTLNVPGIGDGRCAILKSAANILCLQYSADFGVEYCTTTLYPAYQTLVSANGHGYSAFTSDNCSTTNSVGSCDMDKGTIQYYSNGFTALSAAAACTTLHSGSFTVN